jgi:hypothetical protein
LREEWLLELWGMESPDAEEMAEVAKDVVSEASLSSLEGYSAVELLVQSARRVRRDFSLESAEAPSVARICRLVEGMPLAIELAAPWARMMPCSEIARAIERDIGFLASSLRDVPQRHRSMQAVFDHSWGLLSDEEQDVLAKVSVFRGGFQRDAAETVAGASLAELSALVDKSWLRVAPSGRYEMHELIRQYGADRLAAEGGSEETLDRHSEYYTAFLSEREVHLKGWRQRQATQEILAEMGNVRAAWSWAIEQGSVGAMGRSMESLSLVGGRRGWHREMGQEFGRAATKLREQLDSIHAAPGAASSEEETAIVLAHILAWQAHHRYRSGIAEESILLLEESLALLHDVRQSPRQQKASVRAKAMLGWLLDALARDRPRADQLLQEAWDEAAGIGDQWGRVFCAWVLGMIALHSGEYPKAEAYLQQGIAAADQLGDQWFKAWCLDRLGQVLMAGGEYQRAENSSQELYQISHEMADRVALLGSLHRLAAAATALRKYDLAARRYQESLAVAGELGDPHSVAESINGLVTVAYEQGEYVE